MLHFSRMTLLRHHGISVVDNSSHGRDGKQLHLSTTMIIGFNEKSGYKKLRRTKRTILRRNVVRAPELRAVRPLSFPLFCILMTFWNPDIRSFSPGPVCSLPRTLTYLTAALGSRIVSSHAGTLALSSSPASPPTALFALFPQPSLHPVSLAHCSFPFSSVCTLLTQHTVLSPLFRAHLSSLELFRIITSN